MSRRTVLAIDPGTTYSAFALIDAETFRPIEFEKLRNEALLERIGTYSDVPGALSADFIAIEMVASYGMAVGRDVFETCVWIGRFLQAYVDGYGITPQLVTRHHVKLHHCHSAKAKDSNIRQALVDRFASGQAASGKGTKAEPGWFYGFAADVWQAYALATYIADVDAVEATIRRHPAGKGLR